MWCSLCSCTCCTCLWCCTCHKRPSSSTSGNDASTSAVRLTAGVIWLWLPAASVDVTGLLTPTSIAMTCGTPTALEVPTGAGEAVVMWSRVMYCGNSSKDAVSLYSGHAASLSNRRCSMSLVSAYVWRLTCALYRKKRGTKSVRCERIKSNTSHNGVC